VATKAYDRALKAWAKEFRATLDESVRNLIAQANFDLYYGPSGTDEEYPGFETATKTIKEGLAGIPSTLYIDADSETWSDTEPQSEQCEACLGHGVDVKVGSGSQCSECMGQGTFDPAGEWYHLERKDLLTAIVGRELAGYVQ
jgi:hypothetical protein